MRHTRSDNNTNSTRRNSLPLEDGSRQPTSFVLDENEQVVLPRYARYVTHVVLLTWLRMLQCPTLTIALISSTHVAAKQIPNVLVWLDRQHQNRRDRYEQARSAT